MAKEERLSIPPLNFPVPAYNEPSHLEADYVDKVDITATGYVRLAQGVLYNTITGADQNIVTQFPNLFLLAEIINPAGWPFSYRYWASQYVTLQGQDRNKQFGFVIPWTDRFAPQGAEIGTDGEDINPINRQLARIRTTNLSLLNATLGSYILTWPDVADLPMPDVLTGVSSIKNSNFGEGVSSGSGSAGATGDHGSYSLSIPSSNQSSAALSYELLISISSGRDRGRSKQTMRGVFFMLAPYGNADLIAQLNLLVGASVGNWPDFQPQFESLVVSGMSVAVQTEAQVMVHYSYDASSVSSGSTSETSYSYKMGITSGPVRISPTIHGAITIEGDGTTATQTVVSEAQAATTGTVGASAGPVIESATATATVKPTSLSSTPGASAYPTTGFNLLGLNSEPLEEGWIMIHFEVVDMGLFFGSGATAVSLTPVFIQPAGDYVAGPNGLFRIAIYSPNQSASERFTIDGTIPSAGSAGTGTLVPKNRGYIDLPVGTTTVKGIAWTGNVTAQSSVVTAVYVISAAP